MSKLDDALARFGAALERLEASAEEQIAQAHESAGAIAALDHVKAEREELAARVASLQEEARALTGVTEEVEDRLDGAISEIRAVLGRN
jgi:cell division protein FtsB